MKVRHPQFGIGTRAQRRGARRRHEAGGAVRRRSGRRRCGPSTRGSSRPKHCGVRSARHEDKRFGLRRGRVCRAGRVLHLSVVVQPVARGEAPTRRGGGGAVDSDARSGRESDRAPRAAPRHFSRRTSSVRSGEPAQEIASRETRCWRWSAPSGRPPTASTCASPTRRCSSTPTRRRTPIMRVGSDHPGSRSGQPTVESRDASVGLGQDCRRMADHECGVDADPAASLIAVRIQRPVISLSALQHRALHRDDVVLLHGPTVRQLHRRRHRHVLADQFPVVFGDVNPRRPAVDAHVDDDRFERACASRRRLCRDTATPSSRNGSTLPGPRRPPAAASSVRGRPRAPA